jgi:hypothetical protein
MNSIHVYDKKKYFVIFLKRKLSKAYHVKALDNVKFMEVNNFNANDIGVFVANNVNDVAAFFRFRECFVGRIVLCTENISICKKYQNTFKIPYIDISRPKKQFFDDLKCNIDIIDNMFVPEK